MKDWEVIDAFVAHLGMNGHPGLQVDRRPDKENSNSSDIDAIAGHFAIEHTSVDTLTNQRRDSNWFVRAAGGIETELPSKPDFRLSITLEYDAVVKGQNWSTIRDALKTWITTEASSLPDGRHVLGDIPGVPFGLRVTKASHRPPGVFFARAAPEDDSLSERIRQQIDRKAEKLAKYHGAGTTTVLLVENGDIALMNESKILEATLEAYPTGLPPGVDQIWYGDTSIPSETEFRDLTPELEGTPDA